MYLKHAKPKSMTHPYLRSSYVFTFFFGKLGIFTPFHINGRGVVFFGFFVGLGEMYL